MLNINNGSTFRSNTPKRDVNKKESEIHDTNGYAKKKIRRNQFDLGT